MKTVVLVGTGPAALMAADVLSCSKNEVLVFEKKKSPGRKLLIAGSSGLNITNSLPPAQFLKQYSGATQELWEKLLSAFSPQHWLEFIEELGIVTFEGTSGRYFVKDMKASKLLRAWLKRLDERGVQFFFEQECIDFHKDELIFSSGKRQRFDAACLALGGASYEKELRFPELFQKKNLAFTPFRAANVGYQIAWSKPFLEEAEGLPLKNIALTTKLGSRLGDLVITRYGLEGTPVYTLGAVGQAKLDLKPDLSREQVLHKLKAVKENLAPLRRAKKQLKLNTAALALLFHEAPKKSLESCESLAELMKCFPLDFKAPQPLEEAISSSGGLQFSELTPDFMLKKYPSVFAIGEMLDWDAPTGGFLIQGCVSQGFVAGKAMLKYLDRLTS